MPIALTVAGSDPSGGAGIQADLRAFAACDVFGAAVIAALTVQDTTGVTSVEAVSPEQLERQLDAVLDDLPVDVAKSGLLATAENVEVAARRFGRPGAPRLVVDPVLASSSGTPFLDEPGRRALVRRLLPTAHLVTPNAAEAAALTGLTVRDVPSAIRAAEALVGLGARAALVTGGAGWPDAPGRAVDVLVGPGGTTTFDGALVPGAAPRGTGCALSAAIAAALAHGLALDVAVGRAVDAVRAAIATAPALGRGAPMLVLERGAPARGPAT